jgi:hypothetical protein
LSSASAVRKWIPAFIGMTSRFASSCSRTAYAMPRLAGSAEAITG